MFIVLEGIDKQGKSSLARHLAEKTGWEIVKFSKPKGDPYIEYMEFLLNRKEPAILDRYYLGELAYGPVKRGKAGLNTWQVRNIERLLQARNSLNIYCWTDELTTRFNFKNEKEEYLTLDDITPITQHFNDAQDRSRLNWWQFNYLADEQYKTLDGLVLRWLKRTNDNMDVIKSVIDSRMTGSIFSKTLILGEISNVELEQAKYRNVNVGFANGPSAEILYEALGNSNIALSNVKKAHLNNLINLDSELKLPNLEKVICLGNEAMKAYEEWIKNYKTKNLIVKKTFHPAYVARGGITQKEYNQIINKLI